MRVLFLPVIAALWAFPAAAQTSTTNCRTDALGNVTCTTDQSPGIRANPPTDYLKMIGPLSDYRKSEHDEEQLKMMRAQRRALEQAQAQGDSAAAEQKVAQAQKAEAARLIIKGDCAGAEQYALSAGNIALAREVKDYCAK